jgi:nucleoside phosphorylase
MDLQERKELARYLLSNEELITAEIEITNKAVEALVAQPRCATLFDFAYPNGLKPTPLPINPKPDKSDSLPKADIVVIAWTVAEAEALADIFTCPFHRPAMSNPTRNDWYAYDRNFISNFRDKIRRGAPSRGDCDNVNLLGSYFLSTIGTKKVLCFKSELHLNQDGIKTGEGTATLPVKDLFKQIIQETEAKYILTTGTCGATYVDHDLGDVVVTLSAKFRLQDEFKNEIFNGKTYKSNWNVPTQYFHMAEGFMQKHMSKIQEPDILPPTEKYQYNGNPIPTRKNTPNIFLEGLNLPTAAPILTTDYFEFGNSTTNNLENEGCGVEMGDAVLGLVCSELGQQAPKWAVIRNLSDPVINGKLREDAPNSNIPRIRLQTMWAVWYYQTYGYWTSANSALATWAIIAGI